MGDAMLVDEPPPSDDEHGFAAMPGGPRARRVAASIVSIRHLQESAAARRVLAAVGLPWPARTGDLLAVDAVTCLTRRQPEEIVVVGGTREVVELLTSGLRPGAHPDV